LLGGHDSAYHTIKVRLLAFLFVVNGPLEKPRRKMMFCQQSPSSQSIPPNWRNENSPRKNQWASRSGGKINSAVTNLYLSWITGHTKWPKDLIHFAEINNCKTNKIYFVTLSYEGFSWDWVICKLRRCEFQLSREHEGAERVNPL